MGFLRRGKRGMTDRSHIQCRPIDFPSWIPSREEQALQDGRFDLAVLVHRDGCWRLISEGPAN